MMSPALIPALDAGVSSIGLITLKKPFSGMTSMPRPPNSPLVSTCISRNCSAFMYEECGSRPVSMPLMRILHQFLVRDRINVLASHPLEHVAK